MHTREADIGQAPGKYQGVDVEKVDPAHAGASQFVAVDSALFNPAEAPAWGARSAVESMEDATGLTKSFTSGPGADQTLITAGRSSLAAVTSFQRRQGSPLRETDATWDISRQVELYRSGCAETRRADH